MVVAFCLQAISLIVKHRFDNLDRYEPPPPLTAGKAGEHQTRPRLSLKKQLPGTARAAESLSGNVGSLQVGFYNFFEIFHGKTNPITTDQF